MQLVPGRRHSEKTAGPWGTVAHPCQRGRLNFSLAPNILGFLSSPVEPKSPTNAAVSHGVWVLGFLSFLSGSTWQGISFSLLLSGSQRYLEHPIPRQSLGFEKEDEMDSVCVWDLECVPSLNTVDSMGPRLWWNGRHLE